MINVPTYRHLILTGGESFLLAFGKTREQPYSLEKSLLVCGHVEFVDINLFKGKKSDASTHVKLCILL